MDLNEFRSDYQQLLSTVRCVKDVEVWLTAIWRKLPPFPEDHFVEEDLKNGRFLYKGSIYSSKKLSIKASSVIEVDVSRCVGSTWLFCNDHSDGRPLPERLAPCLYFPPDGAPTFFAEKMGDYYFCSDGNHRIYAAYLLDRPVKIIVDSYYELIN